MRFSDSMAFSFEWEFELSEIYTDWFARTYKKLNTFKLGNRKTLEKVVKIHRWIGGDVCFHCLARQCIGCIQLTFSINCVIRIYAGYLFTIHWINSLLFGSIQPFFAPQQ